MDHTLRRKLDRITNILWAGGVTNPVTYIEQISYLIYLKLLDEEEAIRELRGPLLISAVEDVGAEAALGRACTFVQWPLAVAGGIVGSIPAGRRRVPNRT